MIMLGRAGCLIPFLLVINLLFGWIFLGVFYWVLVEAALLIFFLATLSYYAKAIVSDIPCRYPDVIDIEARPADGDEQERRIGADSE